MALDDDPLDPGVTRRDFVGTTLVGSGAALLASSCAPPAAEAADPWTGPGGIGDYRFANGNTAAVVKAGHRIRDGAYDGDLRGVGDTRESYDLVIVGGGFAGMGALHEFRKRRPRGTCLVLDNQAMFGGYAKPNEFDVGGFRVAGAQASMNFVAPETAEERARSYWDELGLPNHFAFAEREDGKTGIRFPKGTSSTIYHGEQTGSTGYFFGGGQTGGQARWVKDMWARDLADAPFHAAYRDGLLALRNRKRQGPPDAVEAARLDGITFADYATRELGVDASVLPFITQGMCITGPEVSALAAKSLPGLDRFADGSEDAVFAERFVSYPGGNTEILQHFVKAVWPDAIGGGRDVAAVAAGAVDPAALDRADSPCRMRLGATVARVRHDGPLATAGHVDVTYAKDGQLRRVRAKAVVMAIGSWVGKHVVADLPGEHRAALDQFLYAPMLIANVALTNWRFLDRLGFATARWFDGFGFYCSVRRPMLGVGRPAPFHPDKPIVMTFYVPFPTPGLPLEAQGPSARMQLYGTSYAEYERRLLAQMRELFAPGGFEARRDVAGIVLNRWGHAFVTPPPGFFFGLNGAPSPLKVAAEPFGRVVFAQSGLEDWAGAARAGAAAVTGVVARGAA